MIVTCGATVSTVKEAMAGVGSKTPAASVARTSNVWGPSDRLEMTRGDVHAAAGFESTQHWKVGS